MFRRWAKPTATTLDVRWAEVQYGVGGRDGGSEAWLNVQPCSRSKGLGWKEMKQSKGRNK